MNLTYQQPSFENSLAGLRPGIPFAKRNAGSPLGGPTFVKVLPKSPTVQTIADLQMGEQVILPTAVGELSVITDLQALREEEQSTESPITKYAFSMTLELLEYANVVLGAAVPRTLLAPDGDGGIRVEWFLEDLNLRVIIPSKPEQNAYVYRRLGRESEIHPFSKSLVVRILRPLLIS